MPDYKTYKYISEEKFFYNEYEYPFDNYVDYSTDPDIYENVLSFSGYLNLVLQVLSIFVSIFHCAVLFQKELRSTPIYILMKGICISDIFNISVEFYFAGVEREWISRIYSLSNLDCLRSDFQVINVTFEILKMIMTACRPISVTLAILMEVIRTLILIFSKAKFFSSVISARCIILLVAVTWFVYYSWNFAFITSLWYPDNLCDDPEVRERSVNFTEYVHVVPTTVADFMSTRELIEHWIRIIPSIFYPIITIEMISRLKKIHKGHKHITHSDSHENLPSLVLFMMITFTLSEGTDGIRTLILVNTHDWRTESLLIKKSLFSTEYIVQILRCFNIISHPFVCYFMSIHYRNTVKRMIGRRKRRMAVMFYLLEYENQIVVQVAPRLSIEHSNDRPRAVSISKL
ncbi:hypothetical protein CAEBREN_21993 [Caenorhabditis brenneri]|uniref:G-protein coupled receptors family 1 profile domain-containing protein n=1 Tax=Caenorhabditis brenneri TaxID=135651 RepID=G0NN26_CAEBE|nr:hypothetical protein CAEBREN_21993 [Caenorhabditis brenneri]